MDYEEKVLCFTEYVTKPFKLSEIEFAGTSYVYEESISTQLDDLGKRVEELRSQGTLSTDVLYRLRRHFKIKNIYHSNAIEGNQLNIGETQMVVQQGLTLTGKSLKDQAEARNLSQAMDYLEDIASDSNRPITELDIRQIHKFVLDGISEEAGRYRQVPVKISGSSFIPTDPESISPEMQALGNWLTGINQQQNYSKGLTLAAAAHTWFVTIHPFMDGNGRVARLLMNLLLIQCGYPIAVITKEDRMRYYDALEESQSSDLTPFLSLLHECIEESMEEWEAAAKEQQEHNEWASSIAEQFTASERRKVENKYEVWKNAMELLRSYLRQSVDLLGTHSGLYGEVRMTDFGNLAPEKYAALLKGKSAKKTWFLRLDFISQGLTVRYLLFFSFPSDEMSRQYQGVAPVIHLATEDPPNSWNYERLEFILASDEPDLLEIGYSLSQEMFVTRHKSQNIQLSRVEEFSKRFFNNVIERHFSSN